MRPTGWSNGNPLPSDAGYGLKISRHDRGRYFERFWVRVILDIPGQRRGPDIRVVLGKMHRTVKRRDRKVAYRKRPGTLATRVSAYRGSVWLGKADFPSPRIRKNGRSATQQVRQRDLIGSNSYIFWSVSCRSRNGCSASLGGNGEIKWDCLIV